MEYLTNLSFTTSGALIDLVDKKVIVYLRDGRKLVGVLRSYDQFANLVLTGTNEYFYHVPTKQYNIIDRGIFIIRGENVAYFGEVDLDTEDQNPYTLNQEPDPDHPQDKTKCLVEKLINQDKALELVARKQRQHALFASNGFAREQAEEDAY